MGQIDRRWESLREIAEEICRVKQACKSRPLGTIESCKEKNCKGRPVCKAIQSCRLAIKLLLEVLTGVECGQFNLSDAIQWNGRLSECEDLDVMLAQEAPAHFKVMRLATTLIDLFMLVTGTKGKRKKK